jgi:hypothetical protein
MRSRFMHWRISFSEKPRKSDVSDLRTLKRRYRVNPISVSTFPGYALTASVKEAKGFRGTQPDEIHLQAAVPIDPGANVGLIAVPQYCGRAR